MKDVVLYKTDIGQQKTQQLRHSLAYPLQLFVIKLGIYQQHSTLYVVSNTPNYLRYEYKIKWWLWSSQ